MFRKLTLTVATLAISAGLAGQANAATSVVKLHTDADTTRFLSRHRERRHDDGEEQLDRPRCSAGSRPTRTPAMRRTRTSLTGRCLTGRAPVGFPVVTAQTCVAGALNQQWRLNVTKDFQLRLNGAAAKHNIAGNGTGVLMALFNARPDMRWHTHAA